MLRSIGRGGVVLGAVLVASCWRPRGAAAGGPRHGDEGARGLRRRALRTRRSTSFAKLYAETLHPVYLRNIGRCHQKMREPQKAIDAFQDYLAKEKKISADERAEIDGYIKEMETLRDEQAREAQAPPPPVAAGRLSRRRPPGCPPPSAGGAAAAPPPRR